MPKCVWSNGMVCTAYLHKSGRSLPCNGTTPACHGKYKDLVETVYRLQKLGIPLIRSPKP